MNKQNKVSTYCLKDPHRRCDDTSWCWGLKQKRYVQKYAFAYVSKWRKIGVHTIQLPETMNSLCKDIKNVNAFAFSVCKFTRLIKANMQQATLIRTNNNILCLISSPQRPDRIWSLVSLLYNGYRWLFPRGWGETTGARSWPLIQTSTPPYICVKSCLIN
jgi:hypothetical protein